MPFSPWVARLYRAVVDGRNLAVVWPAASFSVWSHLVTRPAQYSREVATGVRKPDIEAVSVVITGQAPFVGRLSSMDCSHAWLGGRESVHKY